MSDAITRYELPPAGITLLGYIVRRMHKTKWLTSIPALLAENKSSDALTQVAMYAVTSSTSFGRAYYQPQFNSVGAEISETDPVTGAVVTAKLISTSPHYLITYTAAMPNGDVFSGSEAHNLYAWPLFLQVLDLGGAPLLLFFIYLVNFQIVRVLTARGSQGSPMPALVSIAIAFVFLAGYGGYRLQTLHQQMKTIPDGQQITVLSIQPNVPVSHQSMDVPPEDRENDIKTTLAMSHKAALRYPGADLVVWPEIPLTYHCRTEAGRDIPPLANETGRAFMLPCTSMIGDQGEAYYNSVTFINKDGIVGEEYRKLILVPFGEYIPLERQFPFLRKIFPGVMPFVAGNRGEVIYNFGEGKKLIPSLCYEAIFTEHTRRFVEHGGNVLVNMVDDAWFGQSPASVIHMSLALFRAVEYRIPLIRVTNTGVGIFVQPTGEIISGSQTPLFQKAATAHSLFIPPERSPYQRWGDAFLYGLTAVFIIGLIWICIRHYGFKLKETIRQKSS